MRLIVLVLACSLVAFAASETQSLILTSTCQTAVGTACSGSRTVQASSADAFVDSMGTLWSPTDAKYGVLKAMTLQLGMRHVRSGGDSTAYINNLKDMAASGLKTLYVASAVNGVAPDLTTYWVGTAGGGPSQGYTINDFLKNQVGTGVIDAVEGPNELDVQYGVYKWHPGDASLLCGTSNCGNYYGDYGVAYQIDLYNAIKGDAQTSNVTVIGPTIGTIFPSPFAGRTAGNMTNYADLGGCHPYGTNGNGFGVFPTFAYDGIAQYFNYSDQPSDQNDEYPYEYLWCNSQSNSDTVYGTKPLAATETGYFTSNSHAGVTENVQAKYYPRIYAEQWRHGSPRTSTYRFDDLGYSVTNPQYHYGIIRIDKTPKPAFTAIQSLITLLKEPGASFSPAALAYGVAVSTSGTFTKKQYMHDLLLQKSGGEFYLLFWHEISDAYEFDADGNQINTTSPELTPDALPVTITLPVSIKTATLYTYDANYLLQPQAVSISSNQVALTAKDTISVLRLSTATASVANTFSGSIVGSIH